MADTAATLNPDDLRQTIRDLATRQGFDLCRITRPSIARPHGEALDQWVGNGMHGDMGYMAEPDRIERRKSPTSLLEGVNSVITLAMRHAPPSHSLQQGNAAATRGVIAAYALGDDYHEVMKKRLKAMAAELDVLLGKHEQRVFVDTAPVLEHALAEKAGLGWQGKHSLTIHRELGSWFLLGEIFTTARIEEDAPASFHCGSCSRCLDICPTTAIVAPFVVDAQRCISYLTIEYKGMIPRELRPLLGNRIFGCDDCQSICPWNRHAVAPEPDHLLPRGENILPELASLLVLDEAGFRHRFRKSPVRRTGRAGLLRNVIVAMGNSGSSDFVPMLLTALHDDEPLLRGHAAWALARLATESDRQQTHLHLQQKLAMEEDAMVREEILLAIEQTKETT